MMNRNTYSMVAEQSFMQDCLAFTSVLSNGKKIPVITSRSPAGARVNPHGR